jgi:putative nucleotidyltransferase with HDIG domain
VIPRRVKVGPVLAVLIALGFALPMTAVMRFDVWLVQSGALAIEPNEPAPVTVRVPPFSDGADVFRGGAVVIARGDVADKATAARVAAVRAQTPRGLFGDLAYFVVVLALAAIYTLHLRRSNRGRFLRTQVVLLGAVLALAVIVKVAMLLTAVSVLAVPVALLALAVAMAVDRDAGVATGVLASLVVGLLVPFDIGVTAILLVQAVTASLLLPDRIKRRWRVGLWAGLASAAAAAIAYGVVHYLTRGSAPVDELSRVDASSWIAAGAGGAIAALLAVPLVPVIQAACGEITDGALIQLEDLSHPLLKQIAEKAPGTWQHSLAMANMAEIAANAIGANGRLVRVGAYFHDLGKSLQPKYFIENVESGEQSPHDRIAPEVSCDAIFSHVTEGIALARRSGLPERIIDFMHMHHGDGVLEYFWAKCQDQGNPNGLTSEDFRYPGVPPQSRETAILAICDAVEAASRTLKRPDQQAIGSLVQRIVYGKLHLGQLDESGLSMADLRKINDSLRETIKHAHHGRIEYPWQRAEREEAAREAALTQAARPAARPARDSITQRIMEEPRLDSLDAPRPPWAAGGTGPTRPTERAPDPAAAETVPVSSPPTLSLRPGTSQPILADSVDVAHAATAQVAVPPEPAPEAPPKDEWVVAAKPRWSGTFGAAAEDALATHVRAGTEEVTGVRPGSRTPWGARIADRIDSMLETDDAERADAADAKPPAEIVSDAVPEEAEPVPTQRRAPPPPPGGSGRHRRPSTTLEVDGEDVEATIEVAPSVKGNGPIHGPPPATRAPSRQEDAVVDAAEAGATAEDEPEVTIVPARPQSSMLPPRARTHGKPRDP